MTFRTVSMVSVMALALAGTAVGCKKDDKGDGDKAGAAAGDKDKGKTDKGGDKAKKPDNKAGPFGAFDPAAVEKQLQGAWVMALIGKKEAWNIAGDKITTWNGKQEASRHLVVNSPCTFTVEKRSADGKSGTTHRFIFDGDKLNLTSDVGTRKDGAVVACISNGVFTFKDGKCQKWTKMFDDWRAKDVTCEIKKEGDKEMFVAKDMREHKLTFDGDTLKGGAAWKPAEKKANWDEAKGAIAAK